MLLRGLNEIIEDCKVQEKKKGADYNKFLLYFMNTVYIACLDEDGVRRAGMEDIFLDDFYKSLEKGFIKEADNEEYIENAVYSYMDYIKLEINSFKFSDIDYIEKDLIYSLKEEGECRYFTYDLVSHYYDAFMEESRDYLMECIKETFRESLKVYRNKEQIYDYYTNGRGKEMIVRCSLYHIENPFDRYKEMFEKLENNDFSEFRKAEERVRIKEECENERG